MTKAGLLGLALLSLVSCGTSTGILAERYEVYGVEDGDMLKLRAGPGTGFDTIVGLPNGTLVRLGACTQTGGTRWCQVSLDDGRALSGYASFAYLRKAI